MIHPLRNWLAVGTLTAALALPGLLLGAGPAGAGEPAASTKVFCADMAKVATAGDGLLARPDPVAANRLLLAALVATNFLGLNAPAIMETEAQYEEMWVLDVISMLGYHEGTAAGTTTSVPNPALQMKATVVLKRLDADLHRTCPGDTKAFAHLTTLEKKYDAHG
jgi:hypothetical protein